MRDVKITLDIGPRRLRLGFDYVSGVSPHVSLLCRLELILDVA